MKKYFHLADFLEPVKDQYVYCNRRALKNFCRVLVAQGDVYAYLHETFLKHFYTRMWVEAQRRNQNILLQFNALFEQLTKYIKAVFEGNTLENVEDFIVAWRNCVG